jgi:hypothetical protein
LLLAAAALVSVVLRIVFDIGLGALPVIVALSLVPVVPVVAWDFRMDRKAHDLAVTEGALYSCGTAMQLQLFRRAPQFEAPLREVRFAFVVGGSFPGRLVIDRQGVAWEPSAGIQRFFRVPALRLAWSEIAYAGAIDRRGPRDPGFFEVRLQNGSELAFMTVRTSELRTALRELGLGQPV